MEGNEQSAPRPREQVMPGTGDMHWLPGSEPLSSLAVSSDSQGFSSKEADRADSEELDIRRTVPSLHKSATESEEASPPALERAQQPRPKTSYQTAHMGQASRQGDIIEVQSQQQDHENIELPSTSSGRFVLAYYSVSSPDSPSVCLPHHHQTLGIAEVVQAESPSPSIALQHETQLLDTDGHGQTDPRGHGGGSRSITSITCHSASPPRGPIGNIDPSQPNLVMPARTTFTPRLYNLGHGIFPPPDPH